MRVVADVVRLFDHLNIRMQVNAAGMRRPLHEADAPYGALRQMTRHPLTDIDMTRFAAAGGASGIPGPQASAR